MRSPGSCRGNAVCRSARATGAAVVPLWGGVDAGTRAVRVTAMVVMEVSAGFIVAAGTAGRAGGGVARGLATAILRAGFAAFAAGRRARFAAFPGLADFADRAVLARFAALADFLAGFAFFALLAVFARVVFLPRADLAAGLPRRALLLFFAAMCVFPRMVVTLALHGRLHTRKPRLSTRLPGFDDPMN